MVLCIVSFSWFVTWGIIPVYAGCDIDPMSYHRGLSAGADAKSCLVSLSSCVWRTRNLVIWAKLFTTVLVVTWGELR